MKKLMKSKNRVSQITKALTFCLISSSVLAETNIINWQGDFASADALLNLGTSVATNEGETWAYNINSPKSPIGNYNAAAPSAVFYGVFQTSTRGSAAAAPQTRVMNMPGGKDRIVLRTGAVPANAEAALQGMIFWKLEDSLDAASRGVLNLSAFRNFSAEIAFARGIVSARFAVMNQGKWYLAETPWTVETGSSGQENVSYLLPTPSREAWAEWPLSEETSELPSVPEEFPVAGTSLDHITAIGIFFSAKYTKNRAAIEFSSITATVD